MEDRFGQRLRHERERRRITLESIAANTKIGLALLEGLERDDVSRWPSAIFRRSFIRAYAEAIGLDADATAREFLERFPDPSEVAAVSATNPSAPAADRSSSTVLRLTLADVGQPFTGGRLITDVQRRWAAAAWDAGVVMAIGLALFLVLGTFWTPLGVAMFCYYIGSILLIGNTPGVSLFAPQPPAPVKGPAAPPGFQCDADPSAFMMAPRSSADSGVISLG